MCVRWFEPAPSADTSAQSVEGHRGRRSSVSGRTQGEEELSLWRDTGGGGAQSVEGHRGKKELLLSASGRQTKLLVEDWIIGLESKRGRARNFKMGKNLDFE